MMTETGSRFENMSRDEILAFQGAALKTSVARAAMSPYYAAKFKECGLDIDSIQSAADITKLTFTTKEDLRLGYETQSARRKCMKRELCGLLLTVLLTSGFSLQSIAAKNTGSITVSGVITLTKRSKKPVAKARVIILSSGSEKRQKVETLTDKNGRYRLTDIKPGLNYIWVLAPARKDKDAMPHRSLRIQLNPGKNRVINLTLYTEPPKGVRYLGRIRTKSNSTTPNQARPH